MLPNRWLPPLKWIIEEDVQYRLVSEHILISAEEDEVIDKLLNLAILIKNKNQPNPFRFYLSSLLMKRPKSTSSKKKKNCLPFKHGRCLGDKDQLCKHYRPKYWRWHCPYLPWGDGQPRAFTLARPFVFAWQIYDQQDRSVVNYTDKSIFVVDLVQPLYHTRMILVIPLWVKLKMALYNGSIKCCCLQRTQFESRLFFAQGSVGCVGQRWNYLGYHASIQYIEFTDWEDFLIISRDVREKDLLVCISARKGSVS